jgi:hypothetical protein
LIYFQTLATCEKHEQLPSLDGKVRYRKNLNMEAETNKDGSPKYNDPKYATASDVLMGLDLVIRMGLRRVGVVEGPTDLIQSRGSVALLGKVVSERHIALLRYAGIVEVDHALDPDAWALPVDRFGKPTGRQPPAKTAAELLASAFKVNVVRYPEGTDPGALDPLTNWRMRHEARPFGDGSRLTFLP